MPLPELIPLILSTSNPKFVKKYNFQVKLAQLTGTNGPRDLYSAYNPDFFDKYAAAFAKTITEELVIGYDGSRIHESNSKSALEYMRRIGISIKELDGPITVPEFMFTCYKLGIPGCFFGRSHSPQQYVGLKLVINGNNAVDLLEKNGAEIKRNKGFQGEKIYGFLPRTLAPVIEEIIGKDEAVHPKNIGKKELISSKDMREEFFQSLKKVTPLKKIQGNFIVDCRHSMAGEVWKLIQSEFNGKIKLDNALLNPIAPDRDPREIWDVLTEQYHKCTEAVFSHDADADRTFLVKSPGIGRDKVLVNQEESFTTGLVSEANIRKPDAYILVQERISLLMLSALKKYTDKIYATAQGEPAFFLGVNELLFENTEIKQISGADYTDIFYNKTHPICMKSPYQQALWMMNWFTKNEKMPEFPEVNVLKTQIDMMNLNYPQRLEKVLNSEYEIREYFKKNFEIVYHSTIDGQNLILKDKDENMIISSIRPSGTGRYTKVITEVGLGKALESGRKELASEINKKIEKIIGK